MEVGAAGGGVSVSFSVSVTEFEFVREERYSLDKGTDDRSAIPGGTFGGGVTGRLLKRLEYVSRFLGAWEG